MTDTIELKFVPYVPKGFTGAPVDVVDALKRGRAVLVEEDRWVRSSWFQNKHPEVNVQDPFCNSWKVCAEGAVLVVTVGLHNRPLVAYTDELEPNETLVPEDVGCPWTIYDEIASPDYGEPEDDEELWERSDETQHHLYADAVEQLRRSGEAIYEQREGIRPYCDWAHQLNDQYFTTREDVVAWFDKAIEDAQR